MGLFLYWAKWICLDGTKSNLQLLLIALFVVSCKAEVSANNIYQFRVRDINGAEVSLDRYRNKVVLIVNVASECGLTHINYVQLKDLHDKYKEQGFAVAAFPCNQFEHSEELIFYNYIIEIHHQAVARSLRFSKWKAFLRRYANQQFTFENIIQDFTRQATAAKNINEIEHSRQSVTSGKKSSERSTRSEIIEFLVKYGLPFSLTDN
ncbi:glutathione peroxidase [Onchocerca flexuosa]|uniref:Glutathione peroxidase n=1 Tax=Onchocerca flexuosa TaxID=387005 RepID=A0A238BNS6_9BILA|nr:glutathione peroxidase [Onchocerca flexuosa]